MITKPGTETINHYIKNYISQAEGNDLIQSLNDSLENTLSIYNIITPDKENYCYATGKWSVKDVLAHIIDTERVFTYRALVFARRDNVELPGYEQNEYALYSNAGNRQLQDIIEEYKAVRNATICLFNSFDEKMLDYKGIANNLALTPRILGWMTSGHNMHHYNVLKERYLL